MSEEMTRKGAIEYLINWDKALESQGDSPFSDARRALSYGIHSLETDEAYQLEYERTTKNDLGVDCIPRIEAVDYLCKHCPDDGECFKDCDEIKHLRQMSSVTPQEPKSEWEQDHEILKAYSDGANEVLDKIRAEIEAKCCITVGRENDGAITLHDVFEIIDKYKGESEDKE